MKTTAAAMDSINGGIDNDVSNKRREEKRNRWKQNERKKRNEEEKNNHTKL